MLSLPQCTHIRACAHAHTHTHTHTHTHNDQQSIQIQTQMIQWWFIKTQVGESIRREGGLQVETVISSTEHIMNTEKKRNINGAHSEMALAYNNKYIRDCMISQRPKTYITNPLGCWGGETLFSVCLKSCLSVLSGSVTSGSHVQSKGMSKWKDHVASQTESGGLQEDKKIEQRKKHYTKNIKG